MDADTIYHGWDNPHIQDLVCETLLGPQARAPLQNPLDRGLVRHTAIMTHSMGNLLTTAALQRGKCRLEKDSTTWLSMSGPWHGAGAVTRLREVCADDGPANAPLRELANTLHFCVGKVLPPRCSLCCAAHATRGAFGVPASCARLRDPSLMGWGGEGGQTQSHDPRNNQHNPQCAGYRAPLTRKRYISPHPAQPWHTSYWAP